MADDLKMGNERTTMCNEHCILSLFLSSFSLTIFIFPRHSGATWFLFGFVWYMCVYTYILLEPNNSEYTGMRIFRQESTGYAYLTGSNNRETGRVLSGPFYWLIQTLLTTVINKYMYMLRTSPVVVFSSIQINWILQVFSWMNTQWHTHSHTQKWKKGKCQNKDFPHFRNHLKSCNSLGMLVRLHRKRVVYGTVEHR